MKFRVCYLALSVLVLHSVKAAAPDWTRALADMPLGTYVAGLTRTNCAQVFFAALKADSLVKGIVFMPGATDELYFFRRVNARLTNAAPTLWDAVVAVTNQTPLRATFHPPLLLIYSEEDVLDLEIRVEHARTVEQLKSKLVPGRQEFLDRDWKVIRDHHRGRLGVSIQPLNRISVTRHFYRHTFARWNLTAWETLEATAFAGKTRFSVRRNQVVFDLDERTGTLPRLEGFPE